MVSPCNPLFGPSAGIPCPQASPHPIPPQSPGKSA